LIPWCLLLWSAAPARAEGRSDAALEVVNSYRRAAGLEPVSLDERMSRACREHTRYMVLNAENPALAGLKIHQQDARLPGASSEGAWCGKNADLYRHVGSAAAAVHAWMNSLYHRAPILRPTLRKIGIAETAYAKGGVAAAMMFDPDASAADERRFPVRYPAAEQTGVPLVFAAEDPRPTPTDGIAGYPITLHFPASARFPMLRARLTGASGAEVPVYLSYPDQPASSFEQGGTVCLIPRQPLREKTRYQVHVELTWQGTPRSYDWTFETNGLAPVDARDDAGLRRNEEQTVRVIGRIVAAWESKEDKVFYLRLQGERREGGPTIKIERAVWTALSAGRPPEMFIDRTVRVVSALQGSSVGWTLSVVEAWQLELLPQGALPALDAANGAALRAQEGRRVKVRGLITDGGPATGGKDVYLRLNNRSLVVFMAPAIWRAVAGGRDAKLVVGDDVELEAVPVASGDQLQATVYEPGQLRVLAGELPVVEATDLASLRKHADRRINLRGRVSGGGQVTKGSDRYLELKSGNAAWTITIFIDAKLFHDVAAGKGPEELLGRIVEVEAPPSIEEREGTVQLTVLEPRRLRIAPLGALKRVGAGDTAALLAAAGELITVSGQIQGGAYFDGSRDVFLPLRSEDGAPASVFLDIGAGLWKKVASGAPPSAWNGRLVEARVVPQPEKKELRLKVVQADAVQIVPRPR